MLEFDENQPILAAPHFYWGCCFVCQKPSQGNNAMKRCTRCRSMYYCSPEHQRKHWKRHRKLCNYLCSAAETADLFSFFSNHAGGTKIEWNKFRMNAVRTAEIVLSRSLALDEKEVFLFPRCCRVCRDVKDVMVDCNICFCASYCSEQHRDEHQEEHNKHCRQLQVGMAADIHESQHGVGFPAIPSQLDKRYGGFNSDIASFVPPSLQELEFAFLTNQLSGPLTLLQAADRFGLAGGLKLSDARTLTIHIAGAALYEVIGIIKWEFIAHRLPTCTQLYLVFIGPELEEEGEDSPAVPTCSSCEEKGTLIQYETHLMRYNEYKKCADFREPDIVMVQNCGFSEFNNEKCEEGWDNGWKGLEDLLLPQGTPLVFTSYTKGEAESDLERLHGCSSEDVEVLAKCEENKMRSHRPIRDWELDNDKDVFYSNQFVSVVRSKQ